MTRRNDPAVALLASLDAFRDALAVYVAEARPEPAPDRELLTLSESARRMGVSRSTVTRWADTGAIPTVALDGRRWVAAGDLAALSGLASAVAK